LKIAAVPQVLLLGMLQTGAFTILIQWALVAGGAGKTAVLVYTMPFWTIPIAWWVLGERVRGLQWLAVAIAACGLVLILEPWALRGSLFSNLLAIGAGLVWAASAVQAKRMRRDHQYDLLALTAWQMLFGALAVCVVAVLHPSRPIDPTPYFFGAVVFNAVFATGLAWLLWLFILNNLSAGMAGLSALGIPMIGVLAGWIELGERPSTAEFAGMLLIGGALALTSAWTAWQARRRPR
jgi:drug/metabolite transporter (DMT)-like permease